MLGVSCESEVVVTREIRIEATTSQQQHHQQNQQQQQRSQQQSQDQHQQDRLHPPPTSAQHEATMSLRNHTRLSPVASSSSSHTNSSGGGRMLVSPSSSSAYSALYTHSSCSLSSLHSMTLSTESALSSRAPSPDQPEDNGSLDPCAPVAIGIRGLSPSGTSGAEGMSQRGVSAAAAAAPAVHQPTTVPVSSHARAASSSAASRSSSLLEASSPPRFHTAPDARSYNSQAFRPDSPDSSSSATPSPSPPPPRGFVAKIQWGVLRAVRSVVGPKPVAGKGGSKAPGGIGGGGAAAGGVGPCRLHILSLLLALCYLLALFGSCFFFHSFRERGAGTHSPGGIGRAQGVSPFGSLSLHLAPSAIYSPFLAAGAQNQLRIDLKSATCSLWMENLWPQNSWRSSLLINDHAMDEEEDASWKGMIFAKAAPIPQQQQQPLPSHPQGQHDWLTQQMQQQQQPQQPPAMQQPMMQQPLYDPHAYDAHHYQPQPQPWAQPSQQPQPYAAHGTHFDPHLAAPHMQQQQPLPTHSQPAYNPQLPSQHQQHHDPYAYDPHLDSHLFDSHFDAQHPFPPQQHQQQQHGQQHGQHFDHYDPYADVAHPYDPHYGGAHASTPYAPAYGGAPHPQQQLHGYSQHDHSQAQRDHEYDYLLHHPDALGRYDLDLRGFDPDSPPNLQHSSLGQVKDRLLEKAAEAAAEAEAKAAKDAEAAAAAAAAAKEASSTSAPSSSDTLASSTVAGAAPLPAAAADTHADSSAESDLTVAPSLVLKQHKVDRDREKEVEAAAAAARDAARAAKEEAEKVLADHAAPGSWIAAAIAEVGKPSPPVVHAPPPSASMHSAPSHYSSFRLFPLLFYVGCSGFMLVLPGLHLWIFGANAIAALILLVGQARGEATATAAQAAAAQQSRAGGSSHSSSKGEGETTVGALVRSLLCGCCRKRSTRELRPTPSAISRPSVLSLLRASSLSRWCWALALCCVAGVPAYVMERKYEEQAKRGKKGL